MGKFRNDFAICSDIFKRLVMRLCIFGADGRTGVEVVRYAKFCGVDITAFVYSDTSQFNLLDGVRVQKGDVMNYDQVKEAMRGADAVISVLGHIKGSDPRMQTKGMENIVRVMKGLGVKRVLSLTGTGARVVGDTPSIADRFLNLGVALVDPERIQDGIEHARVLEESGLDYTIVRVLKLGNSTADVGVVKLTNGGPAEFVTSRKKVAKVLVDLINDTAYIGKQPVISG